MHSPAVNLITPVNWLHPLNRGLEAWWLVMLGNNAGSKLVDITKHGNDGTLTNMDTGKAWKGTNRLGGFGALATDGVDDFIEITDHSRLDLTTGMTISFDNNPSTIQLQGIIVKDKGGASDTPYLVRMTGSGTYSLSLFDGAATFENVDTTTVGSVGVWNNIISTYNGSEMTIDFNGTQEATEAATITPVQTTGNLFLCDNPVGANREFHGLIDNIRIWNRALSKSEKKAVYHDSRLGYPETINWIDDSSVLLVGGRVMSSLVNAGGLAAVGGIAGKGGGLAG